MENEICNLIKVWFSVFASVCYCYAIGKLVPKGTRRLVFLLPIVCLFLYLPLHLFAIHFRGPTAFFISWLANFKLLLFAFGKGPLSSDNPSISLPHFVAVACLPIKIQHNVNDTSPKSYIHSQKLEDGKRSYPNYGVKTLLLAILVNVHNCSDYIHPKVVSLLYVMYLYIQLEILLAIAATMAKVLLGQELEPQFNEPYLSTSLQDFWGRRWNLMVSSILRLAVYEPTGNIASGLVGRKWARIPAVMGTFFVSVESVLKKCFGGRWKLPTVISGLLTTGFVMLTGYWLFLPSMYSCKVFERASAECALGIPGSVVHDYNEYIHSKNHHVSSMVSHTIQHPRRIVLALVAPSLGSNHPRTRARVHNSTSHTSRHPQQDFWGKRWNLMSVKGQVAITEADLMALANLIGFVVVTSCWLFFPQAVSSVGQMSGAFEEYAALRSFREGLLLIAVFGRPFHHQKLLANYIGQYREG
ncbi:hypothetical protein NC653_022263 [Populus alba x Populus x berolinensis]|uniref:Wax synthase domain-containing protein n=1 Tax=Populus alba x Populus x berolinensis TaxID=444605 RepID=A0AAD6QAM9_9ROSI|nr:hypothetical protein NC653_022263 [Populus alba x Populus x berolinensis]